MLTKHHKAVTRKEERKEAEACCPTYETLPRAKVPELHQDAAARFRVFLGFIRDLFRVRFRV